MGEVNDLRAAREQLASEVKTLEADAERLQDLYAKQDSVLGNFEQERDSRDRNKARSRCFLAAEPLL